MKSPPQGAPAHDAELLAQRRAAAEAARKQREFDSRFDLIPFAYEQRQLVEDDPAGYARTLAVGDLRIRVLSPNTNIASLRELIAEDAAGELRRYLIQLCEIAFDSKGAAAVLLADDEQVRALAAAYLQLGLFEMAMSERVLRKRFGADWLQEQRVVLVAQPASPVAVRRQGRPRARRLHGARRCHRAALAPSGLSPGRCKPRPRAVGPRSRRRRATGGGR